MNIYFFHSWTLISHNSFRFLFFIFLLLTRRLRELFFRAFIILNLNFSIAYGFLLITLANFLFFRYFSFIFRFFLLTFLNTSTLFLFFIFLFIYIQARRSFWSTYMLFYWWYNWLKVFQFWIDFIVHYFHQFYHLTIYLIV